MHTLVCFCESRRRFFSLLSLKYLYISFFSFSPCSLPAAVLLLVPLLHSPGARPSVSLSPPSLPAFPPLALRSCRVLRGCRVSSGVSPSASPSPWLDPSCLLCVHPIGHAPKLSGGLPSCLLCLVVLWWLPLLVHRQAQNGVTVWADAARICPRPCLLLPMCCRVSRWLSRGFRPSVRVCVLLPAVFWWQ